MKKSKKAFNRNKFPLNKYELLEKENGYGTGKIKRNHCRCITEDTTFVDDLGADSLDIFQIIMGIEETFDIEIDNDDAEKIATVGDAVEQIKNATNN